MATFLIVQRGPEIGKRYDLQGAIVTIGRSDDNDITFDDPYISRYHAVVKQQGDDLIIIDLGSENPVQIRDTPLEPGDPYTLQNRDVVRIGQNILSFIDTSKIPPRPAPTPAPAVAAKPAQASAIAPQAEIAQGASSMPDALQPGSYVSPASRPLDQGLVESVTGSSGTNPSTGRYNPPPMDDDDSEMTVINPNLPSIRNLSEAAPLEDKPTSQPQVQPEQFGSYNSGSSNWENTPTGGYQSSGYGTPTYNPPPVEDEEGERTVMGAPGQGQYNPSTYQQPQSYGQPYDQPQQAGWGQPQYNQYQYGQPQYNQPYGQPQYNQPQYGQPQAQQPVWGQQGQYQQPYGQQYSQTPEPEDSDNEATVIGGPAFQGWNRPAPEQPKPVQETAKDKDSTIKPAPHQLDPDEEDPGDAPTTIIRFDKNKF